MNTTLTSKQAIHLLDTYCFDLPRVDAYQRLAGATVQVFDAPQGDRIEHERNDAGEVVSWLSQDEVDSLIY